MPKGSLGYQDTATPTLAVADPRGLAIKTVQFHRRLPTDPIDARVTHHRFDGAGRLVASRDPRLFILAQTDESIPANLSQVLSLSGITLSSQSVDAGWRLGLPGNAGQLVERWDGRGSHALTEYDEQLRPVALRERGQGIADHTLERFTYADADPAHAIHNQCGQLMRHDDPAGTLHRFEMSLRGALLKQRRHFLLDTDAPDWPESAAERDALLETAEGAATAHEFAPTADVLAQTDAMGNCQRFTYTLAGELNSQRVRLAGNDPVEHVLVKQIHYNAFGLVDSQTAGNGVINQNSYDEVDGRLMERSTRKANGTALQNLKYTYDPVGNVLSIEDEAQPARHFNNQRVQALCTYGYDSLYQLIEANGRESDHGRGGPALPGLLPLPPDPEKIARFKQNYQYDAAGNLLLLVHVGAQSHGRRLIRDGYSNRCLPDQNGRALTPSALLDGFDDNGNLLQLQAGQGLQWDLRNQLQLVRPVMRKDRPDDIECYTYDGNGQRVRKIRNCQAKAQRVTMEVRYLPGLEIRTHSGTGEQLHVLTTSAGDNSVRLLHWVAGKPADISNDQVRYSASDHLGSCTLELDQHAELISQEAFYPFGGTAWRAARSAIEARYKSVRYSNKERDATGLYYYGYRYYAAWLQRWINPDPAGAIDGLNFYRMVRNNPIRLIDSEGLAPPIKDVNKLAEKIMKPASFYTNYYQKGEALAFSQVESNFLAKGYDDELVHLAIENVRKQMIKIDKKLEEPAVPQKSLPASGESFRNMSEFKTIYSTNQGSAAINSAMRTGSGVSVSGPRVINELKRRHGDDRFSGKTGHQEILNITAAAATFKDAEAEQVSQQLYNQKRRKLSIFFRGQGITDSGVEGFKAANENKTILHSKSFLSVSKDESVAENFLDITPPLLPLLMMVEGFSASSVVSPLSVVSEKDLVFSPYADFEVTAVGVREKNSSQYRVNLREVRAHRGARSPMPY